MKRLLAFLVSKLLKPVIAAYISGPTTYRYQDLKICVLPGVFHPRFFFSTRLLLKHLAQLQLSGKSFLELGAGSGLISLFAARRGAAVTACDISQVSVDNVRQNQQRNGLSFPVLHSDLFSALPQQRFDLIVINPPYYKKDPVSEADHAWYCGKNSEYFSRLFSSLGDHLHARSQVIMVLSDGCDIKEIVSLAGMHGFKLEEISSHRKLIEKNFIFSIRSLSVSDVSAPHLI